MINEVRTVDVLKLQVIVGSTRPGRAGKQVGDWVMDNLRESSDFEIQQVDLEAINLPMLDEPVPALMQQYQHQHTKDWSALIDQADAYLFVAAEYNHSVPGALKNAIDYLNHEWRNKPFGIVSYGSPAGGARSAEHLRQIGAELHMASVRDQVLIPHIYAGFNEDGSLIDNDAHAKALEAVMAGLKLWAPAFKTVRDGLKSAV